MKDSRVITRTPKILLLTGTIAAGKTTLAEAMSEVLYERAKRHRC